jgi:hypothetical protein
VDENEPSSLIQQLHGLHEGATSRRAVSGMNVDMKRPETTRAVVRVAVSRDIEAAVETPEVFAGALEAPRQ